MLRRSGELGVLNCNADDGYEPTMSHSFTQTVRIYLYLQASLGRRFDLNIRQATSITL